MIFQRIDKGTLDILPLTDVRTHLHLPSNDTSRDTVIKQYVKTAIEYVEYKTNRVLKSSVWKGYVDDMEPNILINKFPISSIDSIKYYDSDNAQQTLSTSDYIAFIVAKPAHIYITSTKSTYVRPDAVEINFTAGYTTADAVDEQAKQAVLLLTRHLYDNPGVASAVQLHQIPNSIEAFINQIKIELV